MSPRPSQLAHEILSARAEGRLLAGSTAGSGVTLDDAYETQQLVLAARALVGERQVGWKIGYSSDAMRTQMGIQEPNFGPLTNRMVLKDGDAIPGALVQPRIEPEIAVVVGEPLSSSMTITEVRDACQEVRLGLEVVDPVWRDYQFTLEENTADGSSAAYVVVGDQVVEEADLAGLPVTLSVDGRDVARGNTGAAMGHPLIATRWLAGALRSRGRSLRPGDVVFTGGLTQAVPVRPGAEVTADFHGVGTVTVRRPTDPA